VEGSFRTRESLNDYAGIFIYQNTHVSFFKKHKNRIIKYSAKPCKKKKAAVRAAFLDKIVI
jgi:hypothetical protein